MFALGRFGTDAGHPHQSRGLLATIVSFLSCSGQTLLISHEDDQTQRRRAHLGTCPPSNGQQIATTNTPDFRFLLSSRIPQNQAANVFRSLFPRTGVLMAAPSSPIDCLCPYSSAFVWFFRSGLARRLVCIDLQPSQRMYVQQSCLELKNANGREPYRFEVFGLARLICPVS